MWTFYHASVFILTFMSYAFFHATRKTFSNVKSTISDEWSLAVGNDTVVTRPNAVWRAHHMFDSPKDVETYLGVLDAVFMISYAVGLYISGVIGDRIDLRKVLSLGMCTSALTVFVFGSVLEWDHYYNRYLYVAIWILNGLLQSSGWPSVVAIMGNWFGRSSRGFVLGVWSACASVGNIIGALMVSQVLHYGYDVAFLVTSSIMFAGGIVNFFGLVTSPKELGLPCPDDDLPVADVTVDRFGEDIPSLPINTDNSDPVDTDPLLPAQGTSSENEGTKSEQALGFLHALLLPGVILYALSYFCLKLVNYSFFFWLPYYLNGAFGWPESTADKISIWYDVGGIIGGTIAGIISDCFHRRSVVLIPMLIIAIPVLFVYSHSPANMAVNGVLMAVTGFFIGGVSNLISAAIAADLGKQGPVQGNKEALATVTGIIDGTGSVGAALGQILVPIIQEHRGWHFVFYLFMVMTLLTIVCIFPMFWRELPLVIRDFKIWRSKYKFSWYQGLRRKHSTRTASLLSPDSSSDEENRTVQG